MSIRERALVGVYGAGKFLAAALSGDRADDEVVDHRRAVCRVCPNMRIKVAPGAVAESSWCGEPLVETPKSCGCLLSAKTLVASERCPQGKW